MAINFFSIEHGLYQHITLEYFSEWYFFAVVCVELKLSFVSYFYNSDKVAQFVEQV